MVVDEFSNGCGLLTWKSNSRCILAESQTPDGPYVKRTTLVDPNCVGSCPVRDPVTSGWIMSHFGKGNGYYCQDCPAGNGLTPVDPKHAPSGSVKRVRCPKTPTAPNVSSYALQSR